MLRQRCDHVRARCDAGWADCAADRILVPDHFSREAVQAFLHYVYHGARGLWAGQAGWRQGAIFGNKAGVAEGNKGNSHPCWSCS